MADEQMPMEQEPSKSEPPETGAGYDDADEVRQPSRPARAALNLSRRSPPPKVTTRRCAPGQVC